MRCLVTGGAGFIGSHLTDSLLDKGHEVFCIDNLSSGSLANHNPRAEFIFGDATGPTLSRLMKESQFDWVFHLAATVGYIRTLENRADVRQDMIGNRNVMDLSVKTGVKSLVFASAQDVYGNSTPIKNEKVYMSPESHYGRAKKESEEYLKKHNEENGLNAKALRSFSVYGPRQNSGFVIPRILENIRAGKSPIIYGDGKQKRDFIYVKDNVEAMFRRADRAMYEAKETRNAWMMWNPAMDYDPEHQQADNQT